MGVFDAILDSEHHGDGEDHAHGAEVTDVDLARGDDEGEAEQYATEEEGAYAREEKDVGVD